MNKIKENYGNVVFIRFYNLFGYPEKGKELFWKVFDQTRCNYSEFGSFGHIGYISFKWIADQGTSKEDCGYFTFATTAMSGTTISSSRLVSISKFLDSLNDAMSGKTITGVEDIERHLSIYLEPVDSIPTA
jgi:hypothetical protein